jgi:hypothetical protein
MDGLRFPPESTPTPNGRARSESYSRDRPLIREVVEVFQADLRSPCQLRRSLPLFLEAAVCDLDAARPLPDQD